MTAQRSRLGVSAASLALLALLLAVALAAPAARGADRVYWASFAKDKISYANLDGAGGVINLNTGSATVDEPIGLAIDPVAGRVYWANHTGGKISYANLDGSGGGDLETGAATVSGPVGVAVDVAARRIYWANQSGKKISWANLDGSGGEDLKTGTAMIENPGGIVVYPAAGRVYWTDAGFIYGWISYANIDGSGGGTLPITATTPMELPLGLAIDAAAGKLWWANDVGGRISYANLDGSGNADLDVRGLKVDGPYGVALDPAEGKVYFGSTQDDTVAFARMDGTGGAFLPFNAPEGSGVNFPALLETPRGTGAPAASRLRTSLVLKSRPPIVSVGSDLHCDPASWAGDLVESFLYRAPLSISRQWLADGGAVPGATGLTMHVGGAGVYRCAETATNRAGSTTQTSPPVTALGYGISRTGVVSLEVQSPGTLTLSGKGLKRASFDGTGKVSLRPKPTGKPLKKLRRTGRARIRATLRYAPSAGQPVSGPVSIELRKRRRHHHRAG